MGIIATTLSQKKNKNVKSKEIYWVLVKSSTDSIKNENTTLENQLYFWLFWIILNNICALPAREQ